MSPSHRRRSSFKFCFAEADLENDVIIKQRHRLKPSTALVSSVISIGSWAQHLVGFTRRDPGSCGLEFGSSFQPFAAGFEAGRPCKVQRHAQPVPRRQSPEAAIALGEVGVKAIPPT